jgi:polyhydroxybutyrate depolymerase
LAASAGAVPAGKDLFQSRTTALGGRVRTWQLFIPAGLAPGGGLLIAFHPAGGSGATMRRRYGALLEKLAREERFAVAYPDGYQGHFDDCRLHAPYSARKLNIDDVGFSRAIVAAAAADLGTDRRRVYALGYSNGAAMALRLALEAPDLVSGVTAICANLPTPDNLDCPVRDGPHPAIVLIEGTADRVNPYRGGRVNLFGSPAGGGNVYSAEESVQWFARRYGLPRDPRPSYTVRQGALAATWEDWGSPRPRVCLITIEGGGHAVPRRLVGVAPAFLPHTYNSDWPVTAALQVMEGGSLLAAVPQNPTVSEPAADSARHG